MFGRPLLLVDGGLFQIPSLQRHDGVLKRDRQPSKRGTATVLVATSKKPQVIGGSLLDRRGQVVYNS